MSRAKEKGIALFPQFRVAIIKQLGCGCDCLRRGHVKRIKDQVKVGNGKR